MEDFWRDGLMPSVYLERGGLLRCQALRGYWQLLDGMPSGAGVIGRTYATGQSHVLADVSSAPEYLQAGGDVRAEACVPLRAQGRTLGAFNVESPTALPPGLVAEMEEAAQALAERIVALGGLPPESPGDRLARHAVALAGLVDADEIARAVVTAACDVARMDSALLATCDGEGALTLRAASGPLAGAFAALSADALGRMLGWVASVRSCHTDGATGGRGLDGHEDLRAAGAAALAVLPLDAGPGTAGILALADRAPRRLAAQEVELLELLAAQASSSLRTAAAVAALRTRAESDPLTGLGHAATFRDALQEAAGCPVTVGRLALVLADLDGFKQVNDSRGHLAGDELLRRVATALGDALRPGHRLFRVGGDEFAVLMDADGEEDALAAAEELAAAVRTLGPVTLSAGVALGVPGEPGPGLFGRADAALYRAKHAGRDRAAN